MLITDKEVSVLGVCVPQCPLLESPQMGVWSVDTGNGAIDLLRMLRFEMVLVGAEMEDMPLSEFLKRMKLGWPTQKWALMGPPITPQVEIAARMMGPVRIYDDLPPSNELLELAMDIRRRSQSDAFPRREAMSGGGRPRMRRQPAEVRRQLPRNPDGTDT